VENKIMPSEHRVPKMSDGEIYDVTNNFGKFILVKLIMHKADYDFEYVDVDTIVENVRKHLQSQNDITQERITEKTTDYINDNME